MKHKEIRALAAGNLKLIASHISKALTDDFISNEEFNLILEVIEIRNNTKKKLKTEEEKSLIEKGRQEAHESFWRLVEKNQGGKLPF